MRDQVLLYLNGRRHMVDSADTALSLSDYLRYRQRLTGTKIVCSEGDCGACSVLVGRPKDGRLEYQSVDSCILFVFQLEGAHVVSIEGLQQDGQLTPVQQAMVDCHGSQCGFCTPGFVTTMTGMLENRPQLDDADMRCGLTGNLCRCTGYTSILDAGRAVAQDEHKRLEELYPSAEMIADFEQHADDEIALSHTSPETAHKINLPRTLSEALKTLADHPKSTIIAGATDLGVRINKTRNFPTTVLDLNRVSELQQITIADHQLELGARVSWTAMEEICAANIPQFEGIVSVFGSPQIRNMGTLGGNIINASPIADSLPLLHVMHAELELASADGTRRVDINDFYQDYKQFDLHPGEMLTKIVLPLPDESELLRLYKISRRRDLDISSFTAAIRMQVEGGTISSVAIAYGAVGPIILRLSQTEAFLTGQSFSEETMYAAGDIAVSEITPISDVRGSADYRYQLARNVLLKFYHEHQPAVLVA